MNLKDFRISPDTIVWIVISILFVGNILSYKLGYKDGINDEKMGWLEDMELERREDVKRKKEETN